MGYVLMWLIMSAVIFGIDFLIVSVGAGIEMSHWTNFFISIIISAILVANELRRPNHKEYNRKKAMYPKIPEKYLHDKPISSGVLFGKDYHTNKFVSAETGHHVLVCGSTGSGKTATTLIPTLLSCDSGSRQIIDIKSRELAFKTGDINNPKCQIIDFNRQDDYVWGWDIYYKLKRNGKDTEQEVLEVLLEIAHIIVTKGHMSEEFWSDASRNALIGVLLYEFVYKKTYEFIDGIHHMLSMPLQKAMESALNGVTKDSLVCAYLNTLVGCTEEVIFSVDITLKQNLFQFLNNDIVYFLKGNKKRSNPKMLEQEGISQYLCIDEHKLDSGYDRIFCIILSQTLREISSRPTKNEDLAQVYLIWDEWQKLSESVTAIRTMTASFLKTARSKKASVVLAVQNLDNFKKDEIYDILSNIHYLYVLSSNNANSLTTEVVCKMAGTYVEKTKSFSEGKGTSHSTSYTEKPILKPEDLNTLGNDAVLIVSNEGYFRTNKEGTAYYKVEPFKTRFEKLVSVNRNVMRDV